MHTNPSLPSSTLIQHLLEKAGCKYRLIILLMVDGGMRTIDIVRLKREDIDLPRRTLLAGADAPNRQTTISLSDRLFDALLDYLVKLASKGAGTYLFPAGSSSSQPHMNQQTIYQRIRQLSNERTTPSQLRQYARQQNDLTSQALHLKKSPIWPFWTHQRNISIVPMQYGMTHFHIGRQTEMQKIQELTYKKVNLLLLGPMGIGKTHLLDNYKGEHIIRLDDFRYPKKVLVGLLLALFNQDKQAILDHLHQVKDEAHLEKIATKESTKRLCELAIQATPRKGYTIIVDDMTNITKIGADILARLKNHFHVIAAARHVKIDHADCLSNFEKLTLQPLNRLETIEFIDQLSEPLEARIEDYALFQNRIWEHTQGNPLFIIELIERLDKEPVLSNDVLGEVHYAVARQEIDFSVPLIIGFSSLLVLRYLGNELGSNAGAFRLLGGIALVIAFFSRRIFKALRRRYV